MRDLLSAAAFDALPQAQLVLDECDRLVLATEEARHMFGLDTADAGCSLRELKLPAQLVGLFDVPPAARQGATVRDVRWHTAGGERLLDVCITPLRRWQGVCGTSISCSDAQAGHQVQAALTGTHERFPHAIADLRPAIDELEMTMERVRTMLRRLGVASGHLRAADARWHELSDALVSSRRERERLDCELTRQAGKLRERAAWTAELLAFVEGAPVGETGASLARQTGVARRADAASVVAQSAASA